MHYREDYGTPAAKMHGHAAPGWTCSLFAALGDPQSTVYGRNFDWEPTPALLLYTYPADGYASMSMVNLAFLGLSHEQSRDLVALSEAERKLLLRAPFLPIDGMNECGLVVGMAAVPQSQDRANLDRPSIGSLGIIREMLDHARTVDEAIAIMRQYTLRFDGGPPVHYLIAEAAGRAVLVEYGTGELYAIPNDKAWHVATNFLVESVEGDPRQECWRYHTMTEKLEEEAGRLSTEQAMGLLEAVSQGVTQWSAVYEASDRSLIVAMGRDYDAVHTFRLDRSGP